LGTLHNGDEIVSVNGVTVAGETHNFVRFSFLL
jgi:hypothetical protein